MTFLFFSSFYFLMPLLPLYIVDIGASPATVGIVIGAFTISSLALRPLVGLGVDRVGRRAFMAAGAAVFTLAGLLYVAARTVPTLTLVRILHGTGIACFTTASSAYVADIVPASRRGEAISYYGMFINLAMAYAPAAGGLIVDWMGFAGAFIASSAVAALALAVAALLREPRRQPKTAAAAAAAAPDEGSYERGGPRGEGGPRGRRGLAGTLFSKSALFPALVCMTCTITYGAVMAFLPLLAVKRGLAGAGMFFTVYAVSIIVARIVGGYISDRRGRAAAIVPGLISAAAAMVCLVALGGASGMVVAAALYGLGFGLALPSLNVMAIDRAPLAERGAAMATYSALFDLGIASGAIVLGALVAVGGYGLVFGAAALVIGAGLLGFGAGTRARL